MARMETIGADMAQGSRGSETFFELGITYSTGREVAPNLIEAHKWFNIAAMKGNREAAEHRQQIAEELTAAEIAEAQRAAREWLRTH